MQHVFAVCNKEKAEKQVPYGFIQSGCIHVLTKSVICLFFSSIFASFYQVAKVNASAGKQIKKTNAYQ